MVTVQDFYSEYEVYRFSEYISDSEYRKSFPGISGANAARNALAAATERMFEAKLSSREWQQKSVCDEQGEKRVRRNLFLQF